MIDRLRGTLETTRQSSQLVSNGHAQLEALQLHDKELPEAEDARDAWVDTMRRRLDHVRKILVALRRHASVGGRAL